MSEASLGTPPAAPAAPSTNSAPSPAPTAASDAAKPSSGEPAKPATGDSKGLPESRAKPQAERPTDWRAEKKTAAKELREHLDAKRAAESADDDEPAKPAQGKPADQAQPGSQRGPDGKFAPREGQARPDAQLPAQGQQAQTQDPPKRDNGETEARLSRTVRELTNKTTEAEGFKRTNGELTAKVAKFEQLMERGKANPLELLHSVGMTLDDVVQGVVEKKYPAPWMRAQIPDEVRSELDTLKQFRERFETQEQQREQERQQHAQREQDKKDTGSIKQYLQANAERYPFAASLEWAANTVLSATQAAKQTDALPHLAAFEKSMSDTMVGLLGNERVAKALLASKPELRQTLMAALGIGTSQEADPPASDGKGRRGGADGPRSLSQVSSERAPTPVSDKERKREAARALRDFYARQKESDD
jgi:hypothetical protein